MILLASATEMSAPAIARLYLTDADHVRKVIHDFNERGFGALDPDYRGGRPKKTTPELRDEIVAVARGRPDTQGVALTRWSIEKLTAHLASSRSPSSRPRPCGRCWTARASRFSAPAPGNGARTRISRRRPNAYSRSTVTRPRRGRSSALTRWARSN